MFFELLTSDGAFRKINLFNNASTVKQTSSASNEQAQTNRPAVYSSCEGSLVLVAREEIWILPGTTEEAKPKKPHDAITGPDTLTLRESPAKS